jgi:spore maturation protein A
MALWLGFMKVAEAAGLIQLLARAIAPVFRFVFPKVPPDHPAAGAMLMNIAANMLGLDNAATPLGIKAMQELQQLNGEKETASNAMCMFLALNVSSLTLIPASIIGYRVTMHSKNPTSFWVPMIIATACGKVTAITLCKIAERFSKDTPMASEVAATDIVADEEAR